MAAIGTIRKYSGIAIGLIGISILAFVVSDAFNSKATGGFFRKNKNDVGVVSGQSISYQDFQARFDQAVERYKEQNQVENVDDKTRDQIRDELWTMMTDEIIYGQEYEALNITITSVELNNLITGPEPLPSVKQAFTNPKTGVFEKDNLINFLKNLDQAEPRYRNMWLDFEENIMKEQKKQKYNDLIKNSMYVTDLEAQDIYYGKNQLANIEYVALPLKTINDSTVKYTDGDLKKMYDKIKTQYEVEDSRSFDYVTFEITPTKTDTANLFKAMGTLRNEYATTKNDSLFVEVNSDVHFDTLFHPKGFYPANLESFFYANPTTDSVLGPYLDENKIKLAKIVDYKNDTVFYFKASHILIKPEGATLKDTANALKKARELMVKLKKGGKFADTAMKYSGDNGSATKGGDLGWFKEGSMVKPFNDAVKKGKKGDMIVVKSQFGAHLIYITDNKSNLVMRLGVITKNITPSSETYQSVYNQAKTFRAKADNAENFQKFVKEMEINKKIATDIKPNDKEIPGMPNSRKLINTVYQKKKSDVSDIIEMDSRFVIFTITRIVKKGYSPIEDMKDELVKRVIKEKKQETLAKKIEDTKASNLEGVAKSLNLVVDKMTNLNLSMPYLANYGEEKYFTGYVFGSKPGNSMSKPVKGETAVYVFVLKEFSKVEAPKNLEESKKELYNNYQGGMAQYETYQSLKEAAKMQDLRYRFY
jgi:peptidyl-prolyl cis-trans isomerase D